MLGTFMPTVGCFLLMVDQLSMFLNAEMSAA